MSVFTAPIMHPVHPSVHKINTGTYEYDIRWALNTVRQNSTFTCAATARTCPGYVGDPSAANPPRLIATPDNMQAITGGRIVAGQWDDVQTWGAVGDSFTFAGQYQSEVNLTPLITLDASGGVSGNTLAQMDARTAAYISGNSFVYNIIMGGINDIAGAVADISAAMLTTTQSIVAKCLAEPTIPVLCTIPPFKGNVNYNANRMAWADSYDAALKAYATTNGYSVVDLRSILSEADGETLNASYDSGDGLHPNAAGYVAIGEAIIALGINPTVYPMLTTTIAGDTLNPYTLKSTPSGTVKVFTAYPTYAVATAYAAGVQVATLTTAGNRVYMQSSGGTSDAAAVVIADSDIGGAVVADNDINWTVLGYATGLAEQLEAASKNEVVQSRDPNTTWTQRGTFSAVQNLTGADGVANSGWTLSGLDTTSNGDIFQTVTGLTTAKRYEPSLILKQIDTAGVITLTKSGATGTGGWEIDLAKLNTYWEVVDRNHPAVTVVAEFDTDVGTSSGIRILKFSGTGTLSVGYHTCQLELGTFSSSQIPTTTAAKTREVTFLGDQTSGRISAEKGAVNLVVSPNRPANAGTVFPWSSAVDGSNYIAVFATATQVKLRRTIATVDTDLVEDFAYTEDKPFIIEFYWTPAGSGLRAYDIDTDPSGVAWATDSNTDLAKIGIDFEVGTRFGASHLNGEYISCELDIDKEKLNFE